MTVKNRAVLRDFSEALFHELRRMGLTREVAEETRRKITNRALRTYFERRGSVAQRRPAT